MSSKSRQSRSNNSHSRKLSYPDRCSADHKSPTSSKLSAELLSDNSSHVAVTNNNHNSARASPSASHPESPCDLKFSPITDDSADFPEISPKSDDIISSSQLMKKLVVKKSKPKQEKREADKTEQDYFECVRVFNRPGDVKVSSGISLNDLTLNDHRCRVFTNMIL